VSLPGAAVAVAKNARVTTFAAVARINTMLSK
jgi:hypothetical protein